MFDLLRKYMDSLVGITEMPRDRAERIIKDLQERGEVRTRDLRKATEELIERSTRNRRELVQLVQKEIRRQVQTLGLATQADIDRLARRVKALESTKKPARPAAKKATPKKASPKKAPSGSES